MCKAKEDREIYERFNEVTCNNLEELYYLEIDSEALNF